MRFRYLSAAPSRGLRAQVSPRGRAAPLDRSLAQIGTLAWLASCSSPAAQHITVRYYIAADKTRGLNVSVLEQRVAAFYQDTLLVSKLSARVFLVSSFNA